MMALIKEFFSKDKMEDDFSIFFTSAKSAEKKKLLKEVVREANADQRAVTERARQRTKTKTA